MAARRYRARPYSGKVTLFVAAERTIEIVDDPVEQWKPLAKGGVDVITIPGDHLTIVTEPNVRVLAQRLDEYLARANHE